MEEHSTLPTGLGRNSRGARRARRDRGRDARPDSQALRRRLTLKQRDGGADHVILLLTDTRHDRSFLRSAGAGFLADFPAPAATALERLTAGKDPGGSAIVLL
jgi:hypothetical protein